MSDEINYQNNPLHGLNLKSMLTEIVDHYGFELLHAYLYIHSFKTNPSIESSVKFLKKTQWAREKVEGFYLYKFKNLPKVSSDQFDLPPRDRIIPEDQSPGEPAELSLEDAQRLNEERVKRASEYDDLSGRSGGRDSAKPSSRSNDKPWAKSSAKPEYRSESRSEPKSPWKPQPKTSSDAAVKNTGSANLDPWASSRNKFK
jgi:uncharacterized protein (DUF2132 family)